MNRDDVDLDRDRPFGSRSFEEMRPMSYVIDNDVLSWGDVVIGKLPIEIAIVFDRSNGVVMKHGRRDAVASWMDETESRLRSIAQDDMARDLIFATLFADKDTIETINKCIDCTGWAREVFPDVLDLRMSP